MNLIIDMLFDIIYYLILFRVILSWIPHNRYHSIISFVYQITEPILKPFRNMIAYQGFDFSPIILLILLQVIRYYLMIIL